MTSHTLGRDTAGGILHTAPALPGRRRCTARAAWWRISWPYARAVLLAVLLAGTQGCYHYRVAASGPAGANPSTFPRATTVHAVLWGLVQDDSLEHVCAQDEALARVHTTSNFGYSLLTVVTLGIWAPVSIEYECANPTPATGTIGAEPPAEPEKPRLAPPPAPPEKYPFFPWPPPRASASADIPRNLLEAEHSLTRLRDVQRRITEALEQSGYYESSYYAIPSGFALVTKMEQIDSDGTPKQGPQRWSLELQSLPQFSLSAYIRALFRATSGYYRVIVFVVTPYAFTQSTARITSEEVTEWLSGGLNRLPPPIGNLSFSQDYACTALIYEFEREAEAKEPSVRLPSVILGRTHLVKAGIWKALQQ